jgi:hypothetical protein
MVRVGMDGALHITPWEAGETRQPDEGMGAQHDRSLRMVAIADRRSAEHRSRNARQSTRHDGLTIW